jgi:hypothetical protein
MKQRTRKQVLKHEKSKLKRLEESTKASMEKIMKRLQFPRD